MGSCNNSSVAQLVESRTQKQKCMDSNHGVDNRLADLARENWERGKREQEEREKCIFSYQLN